MPANANPAFTKNANVSSAALSAANTKSDGSSTIGTDSFVVWTPDPTNGSNLEFLQLMPTASVAGTAMGATVARFFICDAGSGAVIASQCQPLKEVALPAVTGASSTVANSEIVVPVNRWIPAGKCVIGTVHAAPAANSAWKATGSGGDY